MPLASEIDSMGRNFDGDGRTGGMFRSYEKSNVHEVDLTSGFAEKAAEVVEEAEPTSKIRTLIIGSSFGQSMAKEITASGENGHLVMSSRGESQHVTKPLMEVADVPVINYWLRGLKNCARLQPVNKTTFVMCNEDNVDEFENWASDPKKSFGFKNAHIINNGYSGTERSGVAADLAMAIDKMGTDNHILLIDGDYIPEPDFNMQRIVEHSVVRGKDTVTYITLGEDNDPSDHTMCDLETLPGDRVPLNPSIKKFVPYPKSGASTKSRAAVGPITFLRRTTLPLVKKFFEETKDLPPYHHVYGHLLEYLSKHVEFYGLQVKYMFSVKTVDSFLYADALFEYHAREKRKASQKYKVSDTDSSLTFATEHSMSDVRKRMLHEQFAQEAEKFGDMRRQAIEKEMDLDKILPIFNERYANSLNTKLVGETDRSLPERFTNASLFRHNSKKQHACYVPNNNYYGIKQPSQQEMPMGWSGIKGDFTSSFSAGMFHNTGFVSNNTTSKVHKSLDDF